MHSLTLNAIAPPSGFAASGCQESGNLPGRHFDSFFVFDGKRSHRENITDDKKTEIPVL